MGILANLLSHPLTKGMDLDDPRTTSLRKRIIKEKPFLQNIYEEWYSTVKTLIPELNGKVLEIGAGAGFAKEVIPGLLTSDVLSVSGHDLVCDAAKLPVCESSLKAVIMFNVFHHIIDPVTFLDEASRCVQPGGRIIMIEPWVSPWSRFIYSNFHHEPFNPEQSSWRLSETGPLSGGNDALPWIVFCRDKEKWHDQDKWSIELIREYMPFRYILSGGVSMKSLVPGCFFSPLKVIEEFLPAKLSRILAMFAIIVLQKRTQKND